MPSEKDKRIRDRDRVGQQPAELNFRKIVYTEDELNHARMIVCAGSNDAEDASVILEHLGLLPHQTDWYETNG